ncbi:MAG: inovirus Gp2 family protein [Vibrionaceae bacterium]|nr:inovirus Gp2 family protein [Vibrionaceae bacterium]
MQNSNQQLFNQLPVLDGYELKESYLTSIQNVMNNALADHPRTMMVRFDLHLPSQGNCPDSPQMYDTSVITQFIESFKAHVNADLAKKKGVQKRVHPCHLRYIWAKEMNEARQPHYHLALFVNKDKYFTLGEYRWVSDNLAGMIYKAWHSALGLGFEGGLNLVHFPMDTPIYYIDCNSESYITQYNEAYRRLSYLAKVETKQYGDRTKNFSCSRK